MRAYLISVLVSLALTVASTSAISSTLVTPNPGGFTPPCAITEAGVYSWKSWGYVSGWGGFSCVSGYEGDLTISVSIVPVTSSYSTLVSHAPVATTTDSWPKYYENPKCTWSWWVTSCPPGEFEYVVEYPTFGTLNTDAYVGQGGCFKTVVRMEWYDRSVLRSGGEVMESWLTGDCH